MRILIALLCVFFLCCPALIAGQTELGNPTAQSAVEQGFEDIAARLEEAERLEPAGDWQGAAQIIGEVSAGFAYAAAGVVSGGVGVGAQVLRWIPAPGRGLPIPPTREIPTWDGSGPRSGLFGLNSKSQSNGALRNFYPNEGVEFIFDPSTSTFLVRAPSNGLTHSPLADSIDAPRDQVVGGILTRGSDGTFMTNEASGHFHQNWTPELRTQFTETMRLYGLEFDHRAGM